MAYPGIDRKTFAIGDSDLSVALDAGPRILTYASDGTEQLFADLSGVVIDHPGVDPYPLIGGHRLWRAPEIPAVTYERDDYPVSIHESDAGIKLIGVPDRDGVVKSISARSHGDKTIVDHSLRNGGDHPVTTATWAITQLAPGGVGILPQSSEAADPDGVLPNRSIAVWPYTDISAPEMEFGYSDIRIYASTTKSKAKIGTQNVRGWVAYHSGHTLFVKWSPLHDEERTYPDRGSSIECYRDHRFIELETLGPLVTLEPADVVDHREVWQMIDIDDLLVDEVLASLPIEPEAMRS